MGAKGNAYRILIESHKEKRRLGTLRLRCKLADNIEMDLVEIIWGGTDWI
jgi:hypothetical protein